MWNEYKGNYPITGGKAPRKEFRVLAVQNKALILNKILEALILKNKYLQ